MCSIRADGRLSASEEEDMLALLQKGDSDAFEILVGSYAGMIAAKATVANIKYVEFEDVLQECYMAFLDAARSYSREKGASFRTYSAACVDNRIASVRRKSRTKKSKMLHEHDSLEDNDMAADSKCEPEFAVFDGDRVKVIKRLIAEMLSETENRVLMMYLAGKSYQNISSVLGVSEKSVDNALQRARKKLKAALKEQQ